MPYLVLFALALVTILPIPAVAQSKGMAAGARNIDGKRFLKDLETLASDEYEGRSPSSRGEAKTIAYLTNAFTEIGCTSGNPDGTFVQKVPLLSYRTDPKTELVLSKGDNAKRLAFGDDFVAWTRRVVDHVDLSAGLVFVGYGVVAPEYSWNDFKNVDVRGKIVVMLVNDPPLPDARLFGGSAMTYYGRWTYKFESAFERGAAGCLVVHETGPAGYPWEVVRNSWGGESFTTISSDGKNSGYCPLEGWITTESARGLFAQAGLDFDKAKQLAVSSSFAPMDLGVTAKLTFDNTIRIVESRNFIAKLEGSDPKIKSEYVIYCAHWDHLGIGAPVGDDAIYNGAVDNASGVAALIEIARAFAKTGKRPKRTLLFFAPTAEERGLLGSAYYCDNPLYPLERTVGVINMDGMNMLGKTRDYTIIGLGKSTLDDMVVAAAALQKRTVKPDPEPSKGGYYRSDHFNFAKRGVPALHVSEGIEYIGKPADFGQKERDRYTAQDYHKPSDEFQKNWDPSGAVEDMQLLFQVGFDLANVKDFPVWKDGAEFKAVRERMLKSATK